MGGTGGGIGGGIGGTGSIEDLLRSVGNQNPSI
jgi:hypothetical protein